MSNLGLKKGIFNTIFYINFMKFFCSSILFIHAALRSVWDKVQAFCIKRQMGNCGANVMLKPSTSIFKGVENIFIEGDVRIGRYAMIYTTRARVYIGKKVGIAPYLKIVTGNHRVDKVGVFMFEGDNDKKPENDRDVVIEGDSWFGANVTILSGVTIGRGSVIAAGAVVNQSMPPYSIIGGVPAKLLKYRFSVEEALAHEGLLYSEDKKFLRDEIEQQREDPHGYSVPNISFS